MPGTAIKLCADGRIMICEDGRIKLCGCCYYRINGSIDFSADDLPDEIMVGYNPTMNIGSGSFIATRSGYVFSYTDDDGGTVTVEATTDGWKHTLTPNVGNPNAQIISYSSCLYYDGLGCVCNVGFSYSTLTLSGFNGSVADPLGGPPFTLDSFSGQNTTLPFIGSGGSSAPFGSWSHTIGEGEEALNFTGYFQVLFGDCLETIFVPVVVVVGTDQHGGAFNAFGEFCYQGVPCLLNAPAGNILFSQPGTLTFNDADDNSKETYRVTDLYSSIYVLDGAIDLNRADSCKWVSEDGIWTLIWDSSNHKWKLNNIEKDSGTQASPEGTYTIGEDAHVITIPTP